LRLGVEVGCMLHCTANNRIFPSEPGCPRAAKVMQTLKQNPVMRLMNNRCGSKRAEAQTPPGGRIPSLPRPTYD